MIGANVVIPSYQAFGFSRVRLSRRYSDASTSAHPIFSDRRLRYSRRTMPGFVVQRRSKATLRIGTSFAAHPPVTIV